MKTRMPFGGFFLELLDEQNGTCEYEEYQRKCEEEPPNGILVFIL